MVQYVYLMHEINTIRFFLYKIKMACKMKLRKSTVTKTLNSLKNKTPIKKKPNIEGPRPFTRSKIKKVSF